MKEQMRDNYAYTNSCYRVHCQTAKYVIYTKAASRQSHLMGKSNIPKGVRTEDQL